MPGGSSLQARTRPLRLASGRIPSVPGLSNCLAKATRVSSASRIRGLRGFVRKLARAREPRSFPEASRNLQRIDTDPFPPPRFISRAVKLAMVQSAEGDREFVAHFAAQ